MLSDVADVNDWPALIVNAVWRNGTERLTRHVERDRRQHTEALLQEQSSSSAVFLDCHAPHKCQSYLSVSNHRSYLFIRENAVHNRTVREISAGLKFVGGQSCGACSGIDAPILDLRILEIPERQKLDQCMRSATSLCPDHRRIFCKVLSSISSTIAQTGRSSGAKVTACFPAH